MTNRLSYKPILVLSMLLILGIILSMGTVNSHGTTKVRTVIDGKTKYYTDKAVLNTDYYKFKAKHSGEMVVSTGFVYDHVVVYVKKNGKYKKIGKCECNDFLEAEFHSQGLMVTKGKTYYVRFIGIDFAKDSDFCIVTNEGLFDVDYSNHRKVRIGSIYSWDGGSKKSHARKVYVNDNPMSTPGYMCYGDKKYDWYKFTLSKTGKVTIQLDCMYISNSRARNTINLYNKDGARLFSYKFKFDTKEERSYFWTGHRHSFHRYRNIKLKKGTYYIRIGSGSKYNNVEYVISVRNDGKVWKRIDDLDDFELN